MESTKTNIKAALKAKRLTQTVLSKRLRCSLPFLSQVISGVRTSKRIQAGLAAYIGKSVEDIWPKTEDQQ